MYVAIAYGLVALAVRAQSPPPNDDFTNRIVLAGSPVTFSGSTAWATIEPLETNSFHRTVWWSWTAPVSGRCLLKKVALSDDCDVEVATGTNLQSLNWVLLDRSSVGQSSQGVAWRNTSFPGYAGFDVTAETTYQLRFSSSDFVATGVVFTVELSASVAPQIRLQPLSQTVEENDSALFIVAAFDPSSSYQWRHNGTNLPGATTPVLLFQNVLATQAGSYDAIVGIRTNYTQTTTSAVATLTVLPPAIQPRLMVLSQAAGRLTYQLTGDPARYHLLERSSDLVHWLSLTGNVDGVVISNPLPSVYWPPLLSNAVVSMPLVKEREFVRPQRYLNGRQACINNQLAIRFAKEQWAIDIQSYDYYGPTFQDLLGFDRYIGNGQAFYPNGCPGNMNEYLTVGDLTTNPWCTAPEHKLP